jgi:hypothetical protein
VRSPDRGILTIAANLHKPAKDPLLRRYRSTGTPQEEERMCTEGRKGHEDGLGIEGSDDWVSLSWSVTFQPLEPEADSDGASPEC